jgi:hypothetical protein
MRISLIICSVDSVAICVHGDFQSVDVRSFNKLCMYIVSFVTTCVQICHSV